MTLRLLNSSQLCLVAAGRGSVNVTWSCSLVEIYCRESSELVDKTNLSEELQEGTAL